RRPSSGCSSRRSAPSGRCPSRSTRRRRPRPSSRAACSNRVRSPAPPPPMRRAGGALWSHRDFLKLWTGQTISEFGSQVSQLAIPTVAVLTLKASPFQVAALETVVFLPFLLITLPAGVWVDRWRRRWILIAGDLGRAVLLASIPLAYFLGHLTLAPLFVGTPAARPPLCRGLPRRDPHRLFRRRVPVVPAADCRPRDARRGELE